MNPQPQPSVYYRVDIHLDGNGARPHYIYKSARIDAAIKAAWNHPDSIDATIWTVWKEFSDPDALTRHLLSMQPSRHESPEEIIENVTQRSNEIPTPIPAPTEPTVEWI